MYQRVEYDKVCRYCGKEFTAHHKDKQYCSKKCRDISLRLRKGIPCNPNVEPFKRICSECGKEFETFREATKTCSPECAKKRRKSRHRHRYALSLDEYVKKQKEEKAKRDEIQAIEKEWYKSIHTVERVCKICGSLFYCLDKETRCTCSQKCSRENARLTRNKLHDRRLNKKNIVDRDITLKKLYKRDNGICYICGGACDWSDKTTNNKIIYYGRNYPSKEHVIPLAKGGLHSWENVRLAHLGCNVDKGDTTPTYTKEMSREHARKLAIERSNSKKKTAQYDLDGNLLKIWESTAAITRELGFNNKHIQNVCRKAGYKTGNAYGYHWEYVEEAVNVGIK